METPLYSVTALEDKTGDSGVGTGSGAATMEEWKAAMTKPPPGKPTLQILL